MFAARFGAGLIGAEVTFLAGAAFAMIELIGLRRFPGRCRIAAIPDRTS